MDGLTERLILWGIVTGLMIWYILRYAAKIKKDPAASLVYKIDGEVRVIDIMPGSPAEKAGFIPGDIIMAMNNNFSKNVQTYKNLMQNVGEKIKVLVLRENGPIILTLKVKSILSKI